MEQQAGTAGSMHQLSTSLGHQERKTTSRLMYMATSTTMLIFVVIALCPSSAAASFEPDHNHGDDVACLREFKESVTDPLGYLQSWDFRGGNQVNICNFVGVTCLQPGKVHTLDLAAAGLRGRFPRGLGKCSSLAGLNLSNNFLSGRIPLTICSTKNRKLVSIDVSHNAFFGGLPARVQQCLDSNKRFGNENDDHNELDHQMEVQIANSVDHSSDVLQFQ